jgi:prephenate dehydratase
VPDPVPSTLRQGADRQLDHQVSPPGPGQSARALRVGCLGPAGTFTSQALASQSDLAAAELTMFATMPDVLDAVASGEVDLGFAAIENSIEGTVHLTQDGLVFNHELLIVREVVLDIDLCLLAPPGTTLADVQRVFSIPVAAGQCTRFLHTRLRGTHLVVANSTTEAAQRVSAGEVAPGEAPPVAGAHSLGSAAIGPRQAAELYGLDIIAGDIADHDGNQTRFVVLARDGIPAPSGHDKTTIAVFQKANVPGSLISILQEFAARRINLSKLESRPTKSGGLGDYCFIIDADGHVAEELMADCLRSLRAKQGGVKFLGSYPAAGEHAETARAHADAAWRQADDWVEKLRGRIVP